jgi:hypothetical protein
MRFREFIESTESPAVIDTAKVSPDDQWKLGSAATAEDGYLVGYHVTDDPNEPINVLQQPKKLTATYKHPGRGRYAELGPGLYISAAPELWACRSQNKFEFLRTLSPDDKEKLYQAMMTNLFEKIQPPAYLTQGEFEAAQRDLRAWIADPKNPNAFHFIIHLAGQPYNIPFWKPEFLRRVGIEGARPPQMLKVRLQGKFVDLSNNYGHISRWRPYLMQGYDGAFIKNDPQMVIWRKEAIKGYSVEPLVC